MILYSIVPAEVVFGIGDATETAGYMEAEYMGEQVLVSRREDGDYVISRLLSTNPRSYLDQSFQPGSVVKADGLKIKK